MLNDRILNPEDKSTDDLTLRPDTLTDFIGQRELLENLRIFIEAAKRRDAALDHVLLSGPPGLGKTTLAGIVAKEIGSNLTVTSAQVISKGADLARFLTMLNEKDILFIDEIHSLNRNLEEILYPAMEDYKIDLVVGEGITAQSVQIFSNTVGSTIACIHIILYNTSSRTNFCVSSVLPSIMLRATTLFSLGAFTTS